MSSEFGKRLKVSVFGQSHGRTIGVLIDGLPSGEAVDLPELRAFLARRRPGGALATKRCEADEPVFLSGLENGKTCGSPLCAIIENTDARSEDYAELFDKPRPSHADYAAFIKWQGTADLRGGGHFSGRLTAPLCIAGGIAKQILARRGIGVGAHLSEVGGVEDVSFPLFPDCELFSNLASSDFPMIDENCAKRARQAIEAALRELTSKEREAVVLRDVENLEIREIAKAMNVFEVTVRTHLSNGRLKLRRLLKQKGVHP